MFAPSPKDVDSTMEGAADILRMEMRQPARIQPAADPGGALDRLAEVAKTSFPHLAKARYYTEQEVASKAAALTAAELPDGVSIVVFGSWARAS